MGDPGADFVDYVDRLSAREEATRERQELLDAHEVRLRLSTGFPFLGMLATAGSGKRRRVRCEGETLARGAATRLASPRSAALARAAKRAYLTALLFEWKCASFFPYLPPFQLWRQTTWGGLAVRQVQAIGKRYRPFIDSVQGVLSTPGDDSVLKIILFNLIRMLAVFTIVGAVYVLGQIVQKFIGTEIIKNEEIVIVHEYATKEEATRAQEQQDRLDAERNGLDLDEKIKKH